MKTKLSPIWIFAFLNYLYCDLIGLMDSAHLKGYLEGQVGGMDITPTFLLGASVLMEISMAAILVSKFAPYRWNRWYNIAADLITTLVQIGTLFTPSTGYHWFFSLIEIAATVSIVWLAWNWHESSGSSVLSTV